MLENRINQKNSEKSRKIQENVANFFEKSLVRCLDFPKISTSLKIVAYKPLLIKKTRCSTDPYLINIATIHDIFGRCVVKEDQAMYSY